MARRSTIGENPLDALIPPNPPPPTKNKQDPRRAHPEGNLPTTSVPTPLPPKENRNPARERMTVHLSAELLDRVRNAVYWSPGLTLAEFTEEALQRHMDLLEEKRGEAFPARAGELKRGRPIR